jgi:MFS transporter, BCD family, chlorophyll transporter
MSADAAPAPKPRPSVAAGMQSLLLRLAPIADATSPSLPFWKLFRLALFQVSCGMAAVLLTGALNRVMIVELAMPGWLVALMVSLPLLAAPFRALIGFKSDTHRSVFGWRRLPYIWFGALLQFGGLSIMPFALLILSGTGVGPIGWGYAGAALAFLLIGAGMHTVQTAGLALATDLATDENRHRVVAFHYVMLLIGMMISAIVISLLLVNFTALRLIQVIQGAAVLGLGLCVIAMWGQETRARPGAPTPVATGEGFAEAWKRFAAGGPVARLLTAVGLGAAGFGMQDVLLEPYGGQILGMSVGQTTLLTAIWAAGTLAGFLIAAHHLARNADPYRLSGYGISVGIVAFGFLILAAPLNSALVFEAAAFGIGLGGGLFAVGTMTAAMMLARDGFSGLAIGAWGAVQASAAGLGIAVAGLVRDGVTLAAQAGAFGEAGMSPVFGYIGVYVIEIILLFCALVAIGPLARFTLPEADTTAPRKSFGLADFPT